jgi:GntR family transcriptional repressor for pyruvate dehydrogenase complex
MLGLVLQSELVGLNDLGSALRELEPTCAALAAGRAERATTVVPALKNINESMAAHLDDVNMVTEIGRQFHDQLVRGCGNSTVIAAVGALEALWTSHEQQWADQTAAQGDYPSPKDRRAVLDTHVRLTEAIEAGDVDRTRLLASTHLYDAQTYVLSVEPDTRIYAITPDAFSRPHATRLA